jgi:hypothetical protein
MRYIVGYWPLLALPIGWLVQPDLLILGQDRVGDVTDLGFWPVVILICAIATGKLYWSWWWWGWFGRLLEDAERIQTLRSYARTALGLIRQEGLVDRALDDLRRQRTPERYRKHSLVRYGSLTTLFCMGVWPTPGPRGLAVPACRALGYLPGIHALAGGNAIRVVYLAAAAHGMIKLIW